MARKEFSKTTKREALKRSGGKCEAVGVWYGLESGQRCNAPLSHGVEYDHIVLDANSKDNSLENCAAVCVKCHRHKSAKHDTPTAAKTLRQQDKANGIRRKGAPIKNRGFPSTGKTRTPKQSLAPRALFKETTGDTING